MSDTTPALDEAFERMAAASFELPNGFVNHGAMACEALAVLDCADDIRSNASSSAGVVSLISSSSPDDTAAREHHPAAPFTSLRAGIHAPSERGASAILRKRVSKSAARCSFV